MTRRPLLTAATLTALAAATALLAGCGGAPDHAAESASHGPAAAVDVTPVRLPVPETGVVSVVGDADRLIAAEIRHYRADGGDAADGVRTSYAGADAGYAALCSGQADLVAATTPISASALSTCRTAGLGVVQLVVAADAVVVAIRNETDIGGDCLSTAQARDIFRTGSPYSSWHQVGFDDVPITVGGPSVAQADYRVFDGAVLGSLRPSLGDVRFDYVDNGDDDGARAWISGPADLERRADQATGLQAALADARNQLAEQQQKYAAARDQLTYATSTMAADREIGAGATQLAADQKALYTAQGQVSGAQVWIPQFRARVAAAKAAYLTAHRAQTQLDGLRGRISIFAFDYYEAHEDQLRPMEITQPGRQNCIFPNQQTISNGQYALAQRTLLTTTTRALARGEVRSLLTSVLGRVGDDATAAHLVPVDPATLDQELAWVQGSADPTVLAQPTAHSSDAVEVPAQ